MQNADTKKYKTHLQNADTKKAPIGAFFKET
jgi:hypothetical protein